MLADPALAARLDGALDSKPRVVLLRDADGSLLEAASEGPVPDLEASVADDDLVQLLYT